jgi:hypothetical protein
MVTAFITESMLERKKEFFFVIFLTYFLESRLIEIPLIQSLKTSIRLRVTKSLIKFTDLTQIY